MDNQEALSLITGLIQEYVASLQSTNPAIASAVAFSANNAVGKITYTINQYEILTTPQPESESAIDSTTSN